MINIIFPILIVLLSTQVSFAASPDEMIDAFKKDQRVQEEIHKVRSSTRGTHEEIQVVDLGGSCGFVGCYRYSLVIMRITRKGTNPQTGTVLARVEELKGQIRKIELVEIVPKAIDGGIKKESK